MNNILPHIFKSYVCVELEGNELERFFNMCSFHGIFSERIIPKNNKIVIKLSVKDLYAIRGFAHKTRTSVHIIKRCGPRFFIYRNRFRIPIFVGMLFIIAFCLIIQRYIWRFEIEGNNSITDAQIINYLDGKNIRYGSAINTINCSELEQSFRNDFELIKWISINKSGTALVINLKENHNKAPDEAERGTGDIVADRDGTIYSIVTRTGTPLVKAGDIVHKGDILISGMVELHDDSKNVIGNKEVAADGDILIDCTINVSAQISRCHFVRDKINSLYGFDIYVGNRRISFTDKAISENMDRVSDIYQLKILKNIYIPVYLNKTSLDLYNEYYEMYDDEEIIEECERILDDYLANLGKKGVVIIENHVKIHSDELCGFIGGNLRIRVPAGEFR